ncbi:type II secretion system F family protein [Brachybacterium sp. EF45031]|uniref:type II secretion system F family protein n=1 Tax=Brachybacterium sillae TaxID=2810536 RepID=UPI00217F0103|nr:type II secretion system F family protein [Brachybacterium sillae]MCS6710989.1 type II secretion system F family protein [Brachybacterium sillae]
MSGIAPAAVGAALGLTLGVGLLLLARVVPGWRVPPVEQRIEPYLRRDRGSSLLTPGTEERGRLRVVRTLLGPVADALLGVLERLTGGPEQVEQRLRRAGRRGSVESFRVEQVMAALAGGVAGTILAIAVVAGRGASVLLGLLLIVLGTIGGILLRDHLLTRAVNRRAARMSREFPTVADLLALAVAAGESPVAAMERVARSSSGALPEEFAATVAEIRAGATVSDALIGLGRRTPLESLGRFGEGVAVAIERGTPLADVLRAQAQDAREASRRELMEIAGRREILMLLPVVFFVLPLVIVFAIFPGIAVLDLSL